MLVTLNQSCVVYSTDLDECDRNTNDCDQHASCTNERGSYSCKCNHGFTGDALSAVLSYQIPALYIGNTSA